jgi:hypothetical protein
MRDYLGPVKTAEVQTELGAIYLTPNGLNGMHVNAPHLTVDGVPLQASAFLVSNGQGPPYHFDLLKHYDTRTEIWSTADNALQARLVDGRVADIVVLGKLAQVIVPAVRKFADKNPAVLLEAKRREIHNELAGLEGQIEHDRSKLEKKERELAAVDDALNRLR